MEARLPRAIKTISERMSYGNWKKGLVGASNTVGVTERREVERNGN